jgi:hypothetical protein
MGIPFGVPPRDAWAQQPVIQHAELDCLPNDQYPLLLANIDPGDEIRTCKAYFRSNQYPDFYYVEMEALSSEVNSFQAVLPMPAEETAEVLYYLECVDQSFNGVRTEEYRSQVSASSDCRRRNPAAAWFSGGNPSVVVGATRAGMAAIPPGFKAAGIVGFVSAAGVASGVGGGIGAGTIAAVGAGAAAAATGAVVATGGSDDPPSPATPSGEEPTSAPLATTPSAPPALPTEPAASNEPPQACFSVEPNPPTIEPGESIRLDASCSKADESDSGSDKIAKYAWDLGDGREREGRVITPVYRVAGVYTVTLTVTDSGGSALEAGHGWLQQEGPKSDTTSIEIKVEKKVDVEPPQPKQPVVACFNAFPTSMCALQVDASCSTGPITSYDWVLDYYDDIQTKTATGVVVNTDWYPNCTASPSIKIRLTVHGPGATTDVCDQFVTIYYSRVAQKASQLSTSFSSFLESPAIHKDSEGQIILNGSRLDAIQSGAHFRHQFYGRRGENVVGARTAAGVGKGLWHFDFQGAENFVPGSLKVKLGQVVSVDAHSVTFRINGQGERIEFGFELGSGGH